MALVQLLNQATETGPIAGKVRLVGPKTTCPPTVATGMPAGTQLVTPPITICSNGTELVKTAV